jgi:hypothetical protein
MKVNDPEWTLGSKYHRSYSNMFRVGRTLRLSNRSTTMTSPSTRTTHRPVLSAVTTPEAEGPTVTPLVRKTFCQV